jgi:hypothetical protein
MSERRVAQFLTLILLAHAALLLLALRYRFGLAFFGWLCLSILGAFLGLGFLEGAFGLSSNPTIMEFYSTEVVVTAATWSAIILCFQAPLILISPLFDRERPPTGSIGRFWLSFGYPATDHLDKLLAPVLLAALYYHPIPGFAVTNPVHLGSILGAYYAVLAMGGEHGIIPWFDDGLRAPTTARRARRLKSVIVNRKSAGGGGLPAIIARRDPALQKMTHAKD